MKGNCKPHASAQNNGRRRIKWCLRPINRLGRKKPNDDHYAAVAKGLWYSVKWLPCDGRRRSTRLPFSWRSYGVNSPRSVPSISPNAYPASAFRKRLKDRPFARIALNILTWFGLRPSQSRLAREGDGSYRVLRCQRHRHDNRQ